MTVITCHIVGGDYEAAGRASKEIKEMLKRVGVDSGVIRRAMVAVYEAEMNVVIHAREGRMEAALTPEMLEVRLIDQGPGIADIAQAMREGFSTAPPKARELGFGAGMGLPNIRRSADLFAIHSAVNEGVGLRFAVWLRARPEEEPTPPPALRVHAKQCIRCLMCIHACPTQAIRIHENGPVIAPHRCIGCTTCMQTCPAKVFGLKAPEAPEAPKGRAALVLPPALRGQFRGAADGTAITDALLEDGWDRVVFMDPWEQAFSEAVAAHAARAEKHPVLSPCCPAIVRLVQTSYPSLLELMPPFLSPLEAAVTVLKEERIVYVAQCPAQCLPTRSTGALNRVDPLSPAALLRRLTPCETRILAEETVENGADVSESKTLRIRGLRQAARFLDAVENGRAEDCGLVELYACDWGCFGSPLWPTPPAIAWKRSRPLGKAPVADKAAAIHRGRFFEARPGVRLDADMGKAVVKLARMSRLAASLPGRDCGVCGAPSCMALAEDIVMGSAVEQACPFRKRADSGGEDNLKENE